MLQRLRVFLPLVNDRYCVDFVDKNWISVPRREAVRPCRGVAIDRTGGFILIQIAVSAVYDLETLSHFGHTKWAFLRRHSGGFWVGQAVKDGRSALMKQLEAIALRPVMP